MPLSRVSCCFAVLLLWASSPFAIAETCNVRDTGAKGDGRTNDTRAIQAAVDRCAQAGGGTVLVPAGDYRCGRVRLSSHVTLHLEAGATFHASRKPEDYAGGPGALIVVDQAERIAIVGQGTLRGVGEADLGRRAGVDYRKDWPEFRTGILRVEDCRDVTLRDMTFRVERPIDYSERRKHVGGRRSTHDQRDTLYVRQPAYVTTAHVDGLVVDNLRVLIGDEDFAARPRAALSGHQMQGFVINNVFRRPVGGREAPAVIALDNCRDGLVTHCSDHEGAMTPR